MAHMVYDQEWQAAKTEFEKITGVKKPKESKGVFNAFGAHTGLSGSLKKCEAAYQAAFEVSDLKPKEGAKAVKDFASAAAAYHSAKTSYMTVLEKALAEEFKNRPNPQTKSVYERGLKFLKKELDAIEATMAAEIKALTQKFDAGSKDLSIKQKQLANWEQNINGAIKRAIAGAAKVKANPTPAAYNALFPTAARDITMQLVLARNIEDLRADPDPIHAKLAPWANQNSTTPPTTVPQTATAQQITALIAAFIVEVKKASELANNRAGR
ncbi:MAG: hypothetical protein JO255_07800 [Alphaproteobacteria bacterium]|nr:hypothetical protein [Alphaproteobacteria bacterium]